MNIKKSINLFKENLSIIVIVPVLLGGLWQLLELSRMSISFIRFFSATQLLPDGLLILVVMSFMYGTFELTGLHKVKYNYRKKVIKISVEKPKEFNNYYILNRCNNKLILVDNPIYENKTSLLIVIKILLLSGLIYFSYQIIYDKNSVISALIFLAFSISVGLLILKELLILFFLIYDKWPKNKSIFFEFFESIFKFIILICGVMLIGIILSLLSLFHEKFVLPDNLENIINIDNASNSEKYKYSTIMYYNDKYIFIKHENDDKNVSIEILKFDQLFNKENKRQKNTD